MARNKRIITTSLRGSRGKQGVTGTGDAGADGSNGTDGTTVLYSVDGSYSAGITTATPTSLGAYTFIANSIAQGDIIEMNSTLDVSVVTGVKKAYFYVGGVIKHTLYPSFDMEEGVKYMTFKVVARRVNTTTILTEYTATMYNEYHQEVSKKSFKEKPTIADMTASSNIFAVYGSASGAGETLYLRNFTITQKTA